MIRMWSLNVNMEHRRMNEIDNNFAFLKFVLKLILAYLLYSIQYGICQRDHFCRSLLLESKVVMDGLTYLLLRLVSCQRY